MLHFTMKSIKCPIRIAIELLKLFIHGIFISVLVNATAKLIGCGHL